MPSLNNLCGETGPCSDHHPVAHVIPGPLVEVSCPTCGFQGVMAVETYIDFVMDWEVEKHDAQPQ